MSRDPTERLRWRWLAVWLAVGLAAGVPALLMGAVIAIVLVTRC